MADIDLDIAHDAAARLYAHFYAMGGALAGAALGKGAFERIRFVWVQYLREVFADYFLWTIAE